jgi:hypothetical protein
MLAAKNSRKRMPARSPAAKDCAPLAGKSTLNRLVAL